MSEMRLAILDNDRCVGCQSCMFACNRRHRLGGLSKSAIHISSVGGIERGFSVRVCRACVDPPCADACPTKALVPRENGGVRINKELCNGCQSCITSCILRAITWDKESDNPIICIYCGICAKYCPYGVIGLEKIEEDV